MPIIKLHTEIEAPISEVFNLARSIDIHQKSTQQTKEKAIGGKTSGLIELNETVTWRAKHLGVYQSLTVKITKMEPYHYFRDEMVKGIFKSFTHDHFFKEVNGKTEMIDVFNYTSPLGIFGKLADFIFLKSYLHHFLKQRNEFIKTYALQ